MRFVKKGAIVFLYLQLIKKLVKNTFIALNGKKMDENMDENADYYYFLKKYDLI